MWKELNYAGGEKDIVQNSLEVNLIHCMQRHIKVDFADKVYLG